LIETYNCTLADSTTTVTTATARVTDMSVFDAKQMVHLKYEFEFHDVIF